MQGIIYLNDKISAKSTNEITDNGRQLTDNEKSLQNSP
jgi:hypothetical protein